MINPLKAATGGYLKRQTKAVLIIAVAGYLNFGGVPPISNGNNTAHYIDGSGGDSIEKKQSDKKKIEEQNNLIIAICKAYIECQL